MTTAGNSSELYSSLSTMESMSLLGRGHSTANAMVPAANDSEPGLLGGIFSRQGHSGIHVKFSDVDWATLVRSGGFISQQEVGVEELGLNNCIYLHI